MYVTINELITTIYTTPSLSLDLSVKLKYQSSTVILSIGIKYSVRGSLIVTWITVPGPQSSDI